ncbi:SRPBCC domain-containing protein [Zobellia galactanivorans]|uniref:SRPBCC domain-containing protein n=1 Tax=Zobellia galactanivorans (strain DSM 12802 / CCUG 47099 / CIP 106680 / NCIMB 13871 / Dsij) TaxID=63186 RepID=UPI001C06F378|nr:SRPBCC domain-containing protein [Zobellia galactanivorans]MBU3026365.1 SRPBCC domain-containing protein [Zobellia galactanivorans]
MKNPLESETFINAPIEIVWDLWTNPKHIAKWNNMTDEWHTPIAENDLRVGGRLFLRMEMKDGSDGFDYTCIYDDVVVNKKISHTTSDNRKTEVLFLVIEDGVRLTETFEPESKTPLDIQKDFCQSIIDNFKAYVEKTM